jgi:hypothetical protein
LVNSRIPGLIAVDAGPKTVLLEEFVLPDLRK